MSVGVGTHLGSLEITGFIGRGGMGEVYRARDLKLKREVAIKILPEEFSRDPDRVSRFQREAEVLASLNHPNIASIFDLLEGCPLPRPGTHRRRNACGSHPTRSDSS
jgi:eukaryotic-like serine/threonine-protein kinase